MRLYEFEETNITYHASPMHRLTKNKKKDIEETQMLISEIYEKAPEEIQHTLDKYNVVTDKMYKGRLGDNAGATTTQLYCSPTPEAWMDVQTDEDQDISYYFGGIYKIQTKKPISYNNTPAGMGMVLPEALVYWKDIVSISGPYDSKGNINTKFIDLISKYKVEKQKSYSYDNEIAILKKLKFKNIKQLGDKIVFGGITPHTENIRGRDYIFSKAYLVRFDNKKYTIGYVPDDSNMRDLGNSYSISFDNLEMELQKYK
jgi:hypothetical protein